MRDPARIPVLMRALEALWEAHPDYRFGQLVMNLTRDRDGRFQDPWEWENSEWHRRIDAMYQGAMS